jgi:RNA-directed DNA polymerase
VTEPKEGKTVGTPISDVVSTRLQRIAELAREDRQRSFLSLAHHMDIECLREAYRRTRKDGAPGVDGQTAAEYERRLEENLQSLLDRFKSGTYKAPPVRRTHIPKGDGKTRPIGIPTFEDKVLQRAVTMVLEAVYEQDFRDCSYGFRPGRSAHQALRALWQGLMDMGGGWVVELDIRSFFDTLDWGQLRRFLSQRVRDGVIRRAIDKWLKAGVMEDGALTHPDAGTPQGGVISPLLANVYLHEVLDVWFEREVTPCMKGRCFMIRYADDAVLVFSNEDDARRVLAVLAKRFAKYGLTLHPTKTRHLRFRPRAGEPDEDNRDPESFDFLGFRHHWARSRRGCWVVKRKTTPSRFARALKRAAEWLRTHRHQPVAWQRAQLTKKLRGHAAYYGIRGNSDALGRLTHEVKLLWRKWLDRRGRRSSMTWPTFTLLLERYPLPVLRVAMRTDSRSKPVT